MLKRVSKKDRSKLKLDFEIDDISSQRVKKTTEARRLESLKTSLA